jgi:hypothetical protein
MNPEQIMENDDVIFGVIASALSCASVDAMMARSFDAICM